MRIRLLVPQLVLMMVAGMAIGHMGYAGPVVAEFLLESDGCTNADYPVDEDNDSRRFPKTLRSTDPRVEWSRCAYYIKKPKKKKPTPKVSPGFRAMGEHRADSVSPVGSVTGYVYYAPHSFSGRIRTSVVLTGQGVETHEGESFGSLTFLANRIERLDGRRRYSAGWVKVEGESPLRISISLSQSLAGGVPIRVEAGVGRGFEQVQESDGMMEEFGQIVGNVLQIPREAAFRLNYFIISPQYCSQSLIHDDPTETLLRGDSSDHVLFTAICYGLIPGGRAGYHPNWEQRSSTILKRVDLYESLAHSPQLLSGIADQEMKSRIQSVMLGRIQTFYRWANQHYSSPLKEQLALLKEYRDTLIHLIGQPVRNLLKESGTWRRKKRILSELIQSVKTIPLYQTNQSVTHLVDQLEDSVDTNQRQAPAEIDAVLAQLDDIVAGLDQKILSIEQEVERYASN